MAKVGVLLVAVGVGVFVSTGSALARCSDECHAFAFPLLFSAALTVSGLSLLVLAAVRRALAGKAAPADG
jgi:hypothetical protein